MLVFRFISCPLLAFVNVLCYVFLSVICLHVETILFSPFISFILNCVYSMEAGHGRLTLSCAAASTLRFNILEVMDHGKSEAQTQLL